MSLLAIILLILLGVFLFIVEFLLVPGVTIAGIGGAILLAVAVYMAYSSHGNTVGNYTLAATLLFSIGGLAYALRSKTWRKLMLSQEVEGRVEVGLENGKIKVGDQGKALTRLNPMGKVMVNGMVIEAKSQSGFLDPNTPVEILKVLNTQVIVKSITKKSS